MYLSCLPIDVSQVRGRTWLASPYRIHQRLLMAFPDGKSERLLFRIESNRQPPRILVQSPTLPDWDRAFLDHPVILGRAEQKEVIPALWLGQRLRFVLRANPTIRRKHDRKEPTDEKKDGKRFGLLKEDEQREWLARKGEVGGFRPLAYEARPGGQTEFSAGSGGDRRTQTHVSVDFEGYLEVTDPERFGETLASGIGSAKGFGFGLLLVAAG